jgi:hypothetical protein
MQAILQFITQDAMLARARQRSLARSRLRPSSSAARHVRIISREHTIVVHYKHKRGYQC